MTRRQLCSSREAAQKLIGDGDVLVNGAIADKASRQVLPGDAIVLVGPPPQFVSRGGLKLKEALDVFSIDPSGNRCLDVGSSTGGFTDCLLQAGAREVVAVDVGRAQLHEKLVADPRVEVHEATDIRAVEPANFGVPADLVVCDVSFISVRKILPNMLALLDPFGAAVILVKPQFEAGKAEADRGRGVITDPEIWRRVLTEVVADVTEAGASAVDGTVSPIKGGSGNVEFLILLQTWEDDALLDIDHLITQAQEL